MACVDPLSLESFERRAKEADERLRALEDRFGSMSLDASTTETHPMLAKVLKELKVLEGKLVDAKLKGEEIEKENAVLKEQKAKHEYQILHLKRAVRSLQQ